MKIAAGSKLLFIGDSVTDMERARPVGEGLFEALGRSYPTQVNALLAAHYPERRIRVVNMGTSGNTVRDLAARWETDVFAQQPDWLSIMIGINDVWRQFDSPFIAESHVLPDEYERTLAKLVADTLPRVKQLVLMTPYYIESNPADAMRARMDEYGAICRKIAGQHPGVILIDTQAAFNRVLEYYHSAYFAWDRVHPNTQGHAVLARAFLDGADFEWR